MNYLRAHWRGDVGLHTAIWINLVLIRCIILYADRFTLPPYIEAREPALAAAAIYMLLCHGGVYVWQVVGLLRAAEKQRRGVHAVIWVWTGYLAILLTFIFTLLSVLKAYQALDPERFKPRAPTPEEARAAQYSIDVSQDGRQVYITGAIALGLGDKLRAVLDARPEITGVVLESDGGHVYEGRGVAYLIRDRGLNTIVYKSCKSACATVFIGGKRRALGPDARVGFHQYGMGQYMMMNTVDAAAEQEKDASFYRAQGIKEAFIGRIFDAGHEDIWMPPTADLLDAGVAHEITPSQN